MNAIEKLQRKWDSLSEYHRDLAIGASIPLMILTAILLLISIVPRPHEVTINGDAWTCTRAGTQGIHAVCMAYERKPGVR